MGRVVCQAVDVSGAGRLTCCAILPLQQCMHADGLLCNMRFSGHKGTRQELVSRVPQEMHAALRDVTVCVLLGTMPLFSTTPNIASIAQIIPNHSRHAHSYSALFGTPNTSLTTAAGWVGRSAFVLLLLMMQRAAAQDCSKMKRALAGGDEPGQGGNGQAARSNSMSLSVRRLKTGGDPQFINNCVSEASLFRAQLPCSRRRVCCSNFTGDSLCTLRSTAQQSNSTIQTRKSRSWVHLRHLRVVTRSDFCFCSTTAWTFSSCCYCRQALPIALDLSSSHCRQHSADSRRG